MNTLVWAHNLTLTDLLLRLVIIMKLIVFLILFLSSFDAISHMGHRLVREIQFSLMLVKDKNEIDKVQNFNKKIQIESYSWEIQFLCAETK